MLPAALRLRSSGDFARTIRRGSRAGRETVVVHCTVDPSEVGCRVGFVVSRAVGGAVVRNRVRRRMRGVIVEHTQALPAGGAVVVRALPPAADADYVRLRDDLLSALRTAGRRALERATP